MNGCEFPVETGCRGLDVALAGGSNQMPTAHFFFDGFSPVANTGEPSAMTAWLDRDCLSLLAINQNIAQVGVDSLCSRWRRARGWIDQSSGQGDVVRVMGYSMGCHLAVKFADEARSTRTVRDIWLIAPDPKFRENILDKIDPPSAFEQAQDLWGTCEAPGKAFCAAVKRLSESGHQIRVVCSRADTVAGWEGNVEVMRSECEKDRCCWYEVAVGEGVECGGITFRLDPKRAEGENWVHSQLFTMARKARGGRC
jgi:hypothetical protein